METQPQQTHFSLPGRVVTQRKVPQINGWCMLARTDKSYLADSVTMTPQMETVVDPAWGESEKRAVPRPTWGCQERREYWNRHLSHGATRGGGIPGQLGLQAHL